MGLGGLSSYRFSDSGVPPKKTEILHSGTGEGEGQKSPSRAPALYTTSPTEKMMTAGGPPLDVFDQFHMGDFCPQGEPPSPVPEQGKIVPGEKPPARTGDFCPPQYRNRTWVVNMTRTAVGRTPLPAS